MEYENLKTVLKNSNICDEFDKNNIKAVDKAFFLYIIKKSPEKISVIFYKKLNKAAVLWATLGTAMKNNILLQMADELINSTFMILEANNL